MKMIKWVIAYAICVTALALAGCGHLVPIPTPTASQYDAAYVQCLKTENVNEASPEGQEVLQILETGGFTAQVIEQKIEAIGISLAGTEGQIIVSCAVNAWFQFNPVGAKDKPTSSQAAARIFQAKHLKTLKHNGPTAVAPR